MLVEGVPGVHNKTKYSIRVGVPSIFIAVLKASDSHNGNSCNTLALNPNDAWPHPRQSYPHNHRIIQDVWSVVKNWQTRRQHEWIKTTTWAKSWISEEAKRWAVHTCKLLHGGAAGSLLFNKIKDTILIDKKKSHYSLIDKGDAAPFYIVTP